MNKFAKIVMGVAAVSALATSIAFAGCAKHEHTYSEDWSKDATHHWHAATCEHSNEVKDKAAHSYGENGYCVCGQLTSEAKTYTGEYHYNAYNHEYGIKVSVLTLNDVVLSVEVIDSDYVSVSDTWGDKAIWNDGLAGLLASYEGKTFDEINAVEVECSENGTPSSVSDEDYVITGATQGSGRLVLAVQNAIAYANPYVGEYHYNAWGHEYGIEVEIVIANDQILDLKVINTKNYVSVSDSWENKAIWNDGLEDLVASYVGKDVNDVMMVEVECGEDGTPSTVSDDDYVITGATQGSGRLLLAVQNAINKAYAMTSTGEYHYNAWGHEYGIEVELVIGGMGDILELKIINTKNYVSVSDTWENKAIWNDGLEDLVASYIGKSVMDIMQVEVECGEDGTPSSVSDEDLVITGATQGSGRLVLAVQNAIENAVVETLSGEYHYNAWGHEYGIEVEVTLSMVTGNIVEVKVVDTKNYVSVSDSWENKATWNDGLADLLASYQGKNVAEVLLVQVECAENGTPNSVSDEDYVITGATQGSGRLVLAVQNAIKSLIGE